MINWNQWLVIVPARLSATRLPRKPLVDLGGKPLVVRVYERLSQLATYGAEVLVATDSEEICSVLANHNVPTVMTRADHRSGTDRCAEVAASRHQSYILNVQGDEPFIALSDLEVLVHKMSKERGSMGTLIIKNTKRHDYENPNCVKAVVNDQGQALYFSRSPLPYFRTPANFSFFWQHLGVYAFQRDTLLRFCELEPHALEQAESLEQLRALGHGLPMLTAEAQHPSIGIDTPEDLEAARARFQ